MSAVLEAVALSKSFGGKRALADVSIAVAPGEFLVVVGPSGSGKTTLFRCLTRLTEPDHGEIYLAGRPLRGLRGRALANARREMGVVFQQFNLIRRRSALANVLAGRLGSAALWRVASGQFAGADIARAERALDAVGLAAEASQRADTLSGGEQQRVAIARALAQESRVILADEPVASLDPESAITVLSLMQSLARSRNLAVLCTLRQPPLAERFADRIVRMQGGRLVAVETAR